jgi:cob(I)alamin adenosyltransferase
MKWTHLTKGRGDKGGTDFGIGKRLPKGHRVFQILGEIDMLNAQIGTCKTYALHRKQLQDFNRKYMGYLHLGGKDTKMLDEFLAYLDETLDHAVQELDNLEPEGVKGWQDYDNAWYVATCQARKVERLLCLSWEDRYGSIIFPNIEHGEKVLAIFNRMSKVLYCFGVLESKYE